MKEIYFMIEEDPEGGYNAEALGYSIYTQGNTIPELKSNILDAVKCHFGEEVPHPQVIHLHFVKEEIISYA
jgi:hypothetical protein